MTENERQESEPSKDGIEVDGDTSRKDATIELKGGALKAYVKLLVKSEDDEEDEGESEEEDQSGEA